MNPTLWGRMRFYGRLLGLLACKRRVPPAAAVRQDYDRLSGGYDERFSRHMARHSERMVQSLSLAPGARVLDLACGTGAIALAAAGLVGPGGRVVGIDSSAGMLRAAESKRAKLGLRNVQFIVGDMRHALDHFADGSFDAVTCGWAIGYVDPLELLERVRAKLRAGGAVGIIENMRGTLAPIRRTCVRVAQTLPGDLHYVMDLHFRLPRGAAHLRGLFQAAGLRPGCAWEGSERFVFGNGTAVLDWVLHTGASAGFSRMMSPAVKRQCDELFVTYMERDYLRGGRIEVAHRYVAGVALRED